MYNERRELTGLEHRREDKIPQGYYYLVVHVWIKNKKGEYLISQRSSDRPTYPLMWECAGGSVLKGEESLTGALRETEEEAGIRLSPKDGKLIHSVSGRIADGVMFSDIVDVRLFEYDGKVDPGTATTKEVAQVEWMKRSKIKELFENGEFVKTLGYFFELDGL